MRENRAMRSYVWALAVSTDKTRASRAVRTPPQMLTLEARLLRASRAVHRCLLSACGPKSQPA